MFNPKQIWQHLSESGISMSSYLSLRVSIGLYHWRKNQRNKLLIILDTVNLKCDYEEVKASILWSSFIIKAVYAVLENFKPYITMGFNKWVWGRYTINLCYQMKYLIQIPTLPSDLPQDSLALFISEILPSSGLYLDWLILKEILVVIRMESQ